MSAFIVSHHHIDVIVSWAVENCQFVMDGRSPQELGELLYHANVDSVDYRYDEENPRDYSYTPAHSRRVSAVQIIKACDCLDYQSCERPDWLKSGARSALMSIREQAIAKLPGYHEAKWALDEEQTA